MLLLSNPIYIVGLGKGERSPSRSQAHRGLMGVPCDQVGERSPCSADHKGSPTVSSVGFLASTHVSEEKHERWQASPLREGKSAWRRFFPRPTHHPSKGPLRSSPFLPSPPCLSPDPGRNRWYFAYDKRTQKMLSMHASLLRLMRIDAAHDDCCTDALPSLYKKTRTTLTEPATHL